MKFDKKYEELMEGYKPGYQMFKVGAQREKFQRRTNLLNKLQEMKVLDKKGKVLGLGALQRRLDNYAVVIIFKDGDKTRAEFSKDSEDEAWEKIKNHTPEAKLVEKITI